MLRRILWIVPTLFFVSILVFQFLAWTLPGMRDNKNEDTGAVFFNPHPDNVRDRALEVMERVASDRSDGAASQELAMLGGAALPHVLPRLDELDPAGRARVSLALRPVAQRMGLGTRDDFVSGEAATLFWTRFWQDRALDFRPVVVRRLAKRASERRLTLRRDDIIQLDTYALPELMRALGRVWGEEDVARAQRLTELLGHIASKPDWVVATGATVSEANRVVQQWHNWWTDHRDRYTTLDGLRRATAMVTQTSYGKWARSLSFGLGTGDDGSSVLEGLRKGAPTTLLLVLAGLFGTYPAGAALGCFAALLRTRSRRSIVVVGLGLVAVPTALFRLPWRGDPDGSIGLKTILAAAVMLLLGSTWSLLHQAASSNSKLAEFLARGTRRPPGAWALLRGTGGTSLALFASDLPVLFMAATMLEHGLGLNGVGEATVRALRSGDVPWLMAISLLGAASIGLAQVLGDELSRSMQNAGPFAAARWARRG